MPRRLILILILAVYLVLGALFAFNTPAWQAPDEPAHYNYVAYVAQNGNFPVLHFGDYPHAYLEEIKAARFPPDMPITPIRYESHQPPLYYLLAAPVYSLTSGSRVALRLLSVLLGAGIVLLTYGIARSVTKDELIPLGAAAIVAFLPQHLATVSQVGNDVLAELLLAGVLFVIVRQPEKPGFAPTSSAYQKPGFLVLLGVLLGLILITKTTAYIAVPLALGIVAWRWFAQKVPFRTVLLEAVAVILPAALIALPWYARNLYVYGWPDFLGLIRHEQIVVGQERTADFISQNGWNAYWVRTFEWTFKSFVGVFGWMGAWLDSRVYYLLGVCLGVPLVASILSRMRRAEPLVDCRQAAAILATSALLTLLTYIYYNVSFLQHQGRYLFTALVPIAIFLALGWRRALTGATGRWLAVVLLLWAAVITVLGIVNGSGIPKWPLAITGAFVAVLLLASLLPERWQRLAYALPFALLPLTALYALFSVIAPLLS